MNTLEGDLYDQRLRENTHPAAWPLALQRNAWRT